MTLVFAVMHLYNILYFFIASVHSFFILFLNLVLIIDGMVHDTSVSWPYVLLNRGDTEGINSSKMLCSMFVYALFHVNLCTGLILWFLNNFVV